MEIRDIRAVLFDMDGTLVDSDAVVDRSWSRWATEYGVPAADVLAIAHGNPAEATITRMRPDLSPAERAAAVARVLDIECDDVSDVVATPGALELTALLDEMSLPWAVYTSASTRLAKVRLDAVGISPSILVTLDDVKRGKPDPEGYLRAAELLGVPAVQCLVVEDTVVGLTAGRASGALTAGLKGIVADIELADLHQLGRLFKGSE
ncbi:HAD-IA family hydrolase [Kribbella sp. NPDC058693]|uniref:HAD-IA family hydrolase n=1 Tax=Kribbella sp. NPDC058693 TaxID=3346602 RepID=UPI0036668B63